MPNIASVFKAETTRLARKEVKALLAPLRKSNAQYRRDIAELKRQLQAMRKELEFLSKQERGRLRKPTSASAGEGKRFSPTWLSAHRERLGLSAADYAQLVGVSPQTIYNWEHGKSTPRQAQVAALAAIRGIGKREALRMLEG
jgi:DNA-binding transcriptional regulator YiaG